MVELKGIPRSLWADLADFLSGSIVDILWKLFLVVVVGAIVIALASLGVVGAILAFIILASLISDAVRDNLSDLWNRRWART